MPKEKVNDGGPRITVNASCFDCRYCESKSYTCQGDSGSDVFCTLEGHKVKIGDTTWATPKTCPFLVDALLAEPGKPKENP